MQTLNVAAQDYAAARCLLLHGLFAGLVLGAQAIEKFLKAYLLFNNPQRRVRDLSRSLPKLLEEVSVAFPLSPLSQFTALAEKFWKHYATRYPDDPNRSTSMTTAELVELDKFVILWMVRRRAPR